MTKLTQDDITRLERAISAAVRPVAPHDSFVQNTKQAVLSAARAPLPEGRGFRWTPATIMAVIGAGLALVAAIVWRVLRSRAKA